MLLLEYNQNLSGMEVRATDSYVFEPEHLESQDNPIICLVPPCSIKKVLIVLATVSHRTSQCNYIQFSCTCCHRGQGGDGNSFPVIYRERGSTDKENSRNNVWPYFLFRIDDSVLAVTVYLPPLDGGRVDRVLRLYGGLL